jgi:hypothetical protein
MVILCSETSGNLAATGQRSGDDGCGTGRTASYQPDVLEVHITDKK